MELKLHLKASVSIFLFLVMYTSVYMEITKQIHQKHFFLSSTTFHNLCQYTKTVSCAIIAVWSLNMYLDNKYTMYADLQINYMEHWTLIQHRHTNTLMRFRLRCFPVHTESPPSGKTCQLYFVYFFHITLTD